MDTHQFEQYMNGVAQLAQESRQTSHITAQRLVKTTLINKLVKQTVWCDGSSTPATRAWLDDIHMAMNRVGQKAII